MTPNAHIFFCGIDAELLLVRMSLALIMHIKLHDQNIYTSVSALVE